MKLSQLVFEQQNSLISADGIVEINFDLSKFRNAFAIVKIIFHTEEDEVAKEFRRNASWIKNTIKAKLSKFQFELTDDLIPAYLKKSNDSFYWEIEFKMEFEVIESSFHFTPGEIWDITAFTDRDFAQLYLNSDERKELLAMKIGDVGTFTGVSFDDATVKRVR